MCPVVTKNARKHKSETAKCLVWEFTSGRDNRKTQNYKTETETNTNICSIASQWSVSTLVTTVQEQQANWLRLATVGPWGPALVLGHIEWGERFDISNGSGPFNERERNLITRSPIIYLFRPLADNCLKFWLQNINADTAAVSAQEDRINIFNFTVTYNCYYDYIESPIKVYLESNLFSGGLHWKSLVNYIYLLQKILMNLFILQCAGMKGCEKVTRNYVINSEAECRNELADICITARYIQVTSIPNPIPVFKQTLYRMDFWPQGYELNSILNIPLVEA